MKNLFFPLNKENDSAEVKEIFLNRAFLYGDGFFESMRWHNGKISFFDDHCKRIHSSCEILKFNLASFKEDVLIKQIEEAVSRENITGDARVRLTFFRVAEGFYAPEKSDTAMLMQLLPLPDKEYILNEKGIKLGVFKDQFKACCSLSNIKSINSLVFVLAGIAARENGFDEMVVLNDKGRISESTSSNLFIIKDETVITPPATEGCVEGVMRKQVFRFADQVNIAIQEKPLTLDELNSADEIFISSGVRGLIPVTSFNGKKYEYNLLRKLHSCLP